MSDTADFCPRCGLGHNPALACGMKIGSRPVPLTLGAPLLDAYLAGLARPTP